MKKTTMHLAVRPNLKSKVDALAAQVGKSRSETVSRVLALVIDQLTRQDADVWIRLKKSYLIDTLEI